MCFDLHVVWDMVGSYHRCDSLGARVCHHLCHCWMLFLLLSIVRKMRWKLTARPPRKHGCYMCCFVHTPSLLCWPAVVSVLLLFQFTIAMNKFTIITVYIFYSVGTVFAFISNEKLNDSIQNFNNTVNTAIDHSLDFVVDTQIVRCI